MNTKYTQSQINHSLSILNEVFEHDVNFANLPQSSKETFANALLVAFKIKPEYQVSNGSFSIGDDGLIRVS